MRVVITVEADYDDLHDQNALKADGMAANLKQIAKQIENDYKHHTSEHEKYGTFFQIYRMDAGSNPAKKRADNTAKEILKQMNLDDASTTD